MFYVNGCTSFWRSEPRSWGLTFVSYMHEHSRKAQLGGPRDRSLRVKSSLFCMGNQKITVDRTPADEVGLLTQALARQLITWLGGLIPWLDRPMS